MPAQNLTDHIQRLIFEVYLMNYLCMLWSLLEDMYLNMVTGMDYHQIQLPLHYRVCAQRLVKREKIKRSAMNAKHLQLICILLLPSTPLLITLKCTLNIFATAVTIKCKGLSVPGQEECTTECALTPFVY